MTFSLLCSVLLSGGLGDGSSIGADLSTTVLPFNLDISFALAWPLCCTLESSKSLLNTGDWGPGLLGEGSDSQLSLKSDSLLLFFFFLRPFLFRLRLEGNTKVSTSSLNDTFRHLGDRGGGEWGDIDFRMPLGNVSSSSESCLIIGMALFEGHSIVYSTHVLSLDVLHCVDNLYSVASYCEEWWG